MNKKSLFLFYIFAILMIMFISQVFYLSSVKSMNTEVKAKKILFVKLTGLPDLALSWNNPYIRHRSLSMVSEIYPLDGCLRESDPATYFISNSKLKSTQ